MPEEIAPMVELLDQEFMLGRNRKGSVAAHYPDIFQSANVGNLLVLREEGGPASFCALQDFTIHAGEGVLRGGMIGFVYTRPSLRGAGLARRLLLEAESLLKSRRLDFAVLFTTLPGFYQEQGWGPRDTGLLGMVSQPAIPSAQDAPAQLGVSPTGHDTLTLVEGIRRQTETLWVERGPSTYRRQPLAVNRVSVVFSPSQDAYALVGSAGGRGYLYELCGSEAGFEVIWKALMRSHRELAVNTHATAGVVHWLRRQPGLVLRDQRQALWKWFQPDHFAPSLSLEHIPYFDRI